MDMNTACQSPLRPASARAFDSFYHRRTPQWRDRGALLLALGGATAAGIVILLSALALLG
jgi:hypothetical protein